MTVLVTGATGNNGREILRELAEMGVQVRAMVRRGDEAQAIRGRNVEVVEGDFERPDTLVAALDGVSSALLLSPGEPRMVELQGNFIQAAKRVGLPHIVKFSVSGADLKSPVRFGLWHAQVEQEIRDAHIPFTFLRPNYFMQNFIMFYRTTIAGEGRIYAPMKSARVSMVDVRDNAAVAARVLAERGHEGKTYEITGPAAITFSDVAEQFSRVLGKSVKYVDISMDDNKRAMIAAGMPEWVADAMNEVYAALSAGYAAEVADTVAAVGKKSPVTFERFARDNANAFVAS